MELGHVEGQPEMPEHALDGTAGGQGGHDLHAPFATRALEDVVQKDPPDHRRPRKAPPPRWSTVEAAVTACGSDGIAWSNRRDDSGAGRECRGEDAKVAAEVARGRGTSAIKRSINTCGVNTNEVVPSRQERLSWSSRRPSSSRVSLLPAIGGRASARAPPR